MRRHQQSTEREHKQACLVLNNNERLHRSSIFPLPKCHNCAASVTLFYFFFPSLKLIKHDDQNAGRQMESLRFGVLICETGRCFHKEQMMTVPTVALYIIISPYQLFFQSQHMCYMSPLCTGYRAPKEKREPASCNMMYARRQFKLGPRLSLINTECTKY